MVITASEIKAWQEAAIDRRRIGFYIASAMHGYKRRVRLSLRVSHAVVASKLTTVGSSVSHDISGTLVL